MKFAKYLLILWIGLLLLGSCASKKEKAAAERRNLMMPKTSEIKRNSTKYNPGKAKKTYSTAKKRKKPKK
ncbi:MAG: hypothetical protein JXA77_01105 [Bacteroidales bacterium]|nr:hypothetical protein [Bacteroidales bacterium]MBN2818378.1 hypothetical protein [Bacteroidales bacterium]